MSNLPERSSWTGPASSGSVRESGGGNSEMSTLVPIDASGGIRLHPGPGPFAAGPGPFPNCVGVCSSSWRLSAADATAEKSVIATAVAEISKPAHLDPLLMFALVLLG